DFFAWADSGNRIGVAIQGPPVLNDLTHILVTTRPSGAGNGNYAALDDITASGPLPSFDLNVASNLAGQAVIAWRQGQAALLPLGEIYGSIYTPGGTFGATFNLSQSPGLGSHGPIFVLQTDAGPAYVSWLETVTVQLTNDVYFAMKP